MEDKIIKCSKCDHVGPMKRRLSAHLLWVLVPGSFFVGGPLALLIVLGLYFALGRKYKCPSCGTLVADESVSLVKTDFLVLGFIGLFLVAISLMPIDKSKTVNESYKSSRTTESTSKTNQMTQTVQPSTNSSKQDSFEWSWEKSDRLKREYAEEQARKYRKEKERDNKAKNACMSALSRKANVHDAYFFFDGNTSTGYKFKGKAEDSSGTYTVFCYLNENFSVRDISITQNGYDVMKSSGY